MLYSPIILNMSYIVGLSKVQESENIEPLLLEANQSLQNNPITSQKISGKKISFKFAKKLFQLRRSTEGLNFNEGYADADHKELVKVETSTGLILSDEESKTAQILNPSTGKLEKLESNRPIKQGEIVILNILNYARNERGKVNGKLDRTNIRIRFIEHIPHQIKGATNITGAILNIHGINSNLSMSAERAKYAAIIRHNLIHPGSQQLFISYDPPGYGLSGYAKIEMTQNEGYRLEELMIASMSLMAIYTSSKAREVSLEEDVGLSIHAHSISSAVATTLAADVFEGEKRSYSGVFVPGRNLLNLKSISLDSPYINFYDTYEDTEHALFRNFLYNKLGMPRIDTIKKMQTLAMNIPVGFKIDIIQMRTIGEEFRRDASNRYAEKVAAAAIHGIQNNEHYNNDGKEGIVTLYLVNEATQHGNTAKRFGTNDENKVNEKGQSHNKASYNFFDGLKKASADILGDGSIITKLLEKAAGQDATEIRDLGDDSKNEQCHKYASVYDERIKRLIDSVGYTNENHSTNRSPGGQVTASEKILNLYSHEAVLLARLYKADKGNILIPRYYKIYQDIAQKVKGNVDKILFKQKPKEPLKKSKRFMKGKKG